MNITAPLTRCIVHDAIITGFITRDGYGNCGKCWSDRRREWSADPMVTMGPKTRAGQRERAAFRDRLRRQLVATIVEHRTGMLPGDAAGRWPHFVSDIAYEAERYLAQW